MKDKLTIYAAMTGGFGSLAQVLPVLEELDTKQYRIVCSIHQSAAVAAGRLGYEIIPYPEIDPPGLITPKGRDWCDLDQYWGRFGFADEDYFRRLISSRLQLLEEIKPDILLTQFCPPTEVMARITKLPLICFTQSCWHPKGKSISWWEKKSADYPRVTPVVNAILKRYTCAPIARTEELNTGDLTILPSFPEFDPVNDPNVIYTGPMSWDSADSIAGNLPEDLLSLDPSKTICVYTGHLFDSAGESGILILRTIAEAIRDTDYTAIVTTGLGQQTISDIPELPNLKIFDWLPLRKLLDRCALFIHHGGHGSCMTSIGAGIPTLVIPTFQEREFNARQMQLLGIGDFLLPENLNGNTLREKIRNCISGSAMKKQVQELKKELENRNYAGAKLAAEKINLFCRKYF